MITILLLISGLAILHILFGLFTPYNYLTAKWDLLKGKPQLVIYGLPRKSDKEAFSIAPQFGFRYKYGAGCNVSQAMVNGFEGYNNVMNNYLESKLGKDWSKKFDMQVDSIFTINRTDTIRKLILSESSIKEWDSILTSSSNGKRQLYVWVLPKKIDEANVRVGEIMTDSTLRIYSYFYVDPYTLKIEPIHY